jgi:tetratricopeptide (TPR) repeat protein
MTHTSDSLISIAANYFERQKNTFRKAKAWYYMGRVNQDILQAEKAIDSYLKAIPYAESIQQYRLLALIYNHTSNLYRQQKMYEKALSSAEKAYEYCKLTGDPNMVAFGLRDLGRVYLFMDQVDEAIDYYRQALQLAEENNNTEQQVSILNDIAVAYETLGNYREALSTVTRANTLTCNEDDKLTNYVSLGSLYIEMNQPDSAKLYLDEAQKSDNVFVQAGANYYLYLLSKDKDSFENALAYYEQYQKLNYEATQSEQKEEILKLTHQYEQRELKKEMELRTMRERFVYSCLILFLLVVLAVGFFVYLRFRWSQERVLRLQEKQIQYEKELRLLSEEQIKENREQIASNHHKLKSREEALKSVQRDLLNYNTKLLHAENELITLRREEREFRNKLFEQTGLNEKIRIAGLDFRKKDTFNKPFTVRNFPELTQTLDEIYNNFVQRLQERYPQLKERDLQICCLLKAGAKTGNIADIVAMTPNAVTKKKRQILDKMEIIDKDASLEELLDAF